MKSRLLQIDVVRAVAISLVTGFHIWRYLGQFGIYLNDNLDFNLLGFLENGQIGVEIFFIISGFCMAISTKGLNEQRNYLEYYLKRYLRIAPPYYFAILFWNLAISFGISVTPNNFYHNIMHVLFIHNMDPATFHSISGVFWSLAVEMQFYIILPFLLPAMKTKKKAFFLLCATLVLSVVVNVFFSYKLAQWSLLSYLFLFVFGAVLSEYSDKFKLCRHKKFIVISLTAVSFVLISYVGPLTSVNRIYNILTATVIGILLLMNGSFFEQNKNLFIIKALGFIGLISYSIYLYNYIIFIPIHFTKNIPVINWITPIFSVIIVGYIAYMFLEKGSNKLRLKLIDNIKIKHDIQN
jgi:peptidoglycan/LPS O-acetylase OafA/YrhL